MNGAVLYSSKTDMWATPQDFFDALDAEFHFTLDVCAVKENAKCADYYTPEQDGLTQSWTGRVWCNPPYGRNVGQWVKKAHDTASGGGCRHAATRPHRYAVVSRLYLRKNRSQIRQRPLEIRRLSERGPVSKYGCDFWRRTQMYIVALIAAIILVAAFFSY